MWDIEGDDFCNLVHELFSIGCLSESFNQGLIKLIPKNTLRYFIGGWWLITLLIIAYKIMAKDLAMRV
jgi:hypothetical protein